MARVIDSGWVILGPEVEAFECEWAESIGASHCVGVASGSDALTLALRALEIGPGDEVLTVANAGGYATQAILAEGACPVYVDIEAESLLMAASILRSAARPTCRAVIVTHLYGRMVDMPAVMAVAGSLGIPVIEDAAQAHYATWAGRAAGTWGTLGCFSFYPTKNLGALGDAGAVCCNDAALAQKLRRLRQYGWHPKYEVVMPGGANSRLDEMQAACLRILLPMLAESHALRQRVAGRYVDAFAELPIGASLVRPTIACDANHLFVLQHPERRRLQQQLALRSIQTAVHYPVPDHLQSGFQSRVTRLGLPAMPGRGALPTSELACDTVISLPCHPYLQDDEITAVTTAVREAW
jgi:dTDP-4-amino-4,6-dideoxygalactose transaminase